MDTSNGTLITVEIRGKAYQVPSGITAINAFWYAGHNVIRGIGCLGGTCGSCAIIYRTKDSNDGKIDLGCQTLVEDGMAFELVPNVMPWPMGWNPYPKGKAKHRLEELTDPKAQLLAFYPEASHCRNCNACNLACPQDILIKECVWGAVDGRFAEVTELFKTCIMCGLCTSVCPESMAPALYGLYASRVQGGLLLKKPADLAARIKEVEAGRFDADWGRALQSLALAPSRPKA